MDSPKGSFGSSSSSLSAITGPSTTSGLGCGGFVRKYYRWSAMRRRKPIERSAEQNALPKVLSLIDLCTYGVAATVGSGIFVIAGTVARLYAGPAIIISILIAGIASLITGFCYLEFAGQIPSSGSAYVYTYTVLGELFGWFIGWNLTLEYSFSAAAVAGSWTGYLVSLFETFNLSVPKGLYHIETGSPYFIINPLAAVIVAVLICVIMTGIKFTAWFNNIVTLLNVGVILLIIIAGAVFVDPSNWKPFVPPQHGVSGIFQGAALMFFAYIGFDTVCTLTAEAKKPRDIYIAVIFTVTLATVFYFFAAFVLTGMVFYQDIDKTAPLSMAFISHRCYWVGYTVAICSVTTMTATMLACMLGQPRIFYAMALDGLIPPVFGRVYKNNTPIAGVLLTGAITGILALFVYVDALTEMISLGILLTFAVVASGLLVLRFRQSPNTHTKGPYSVLVLGLGSFLTWMLLSHGAPLAAVLSVGGVCLVIPFIVVLVLFYKNYGALRSKTMGFKCPLVPILPAIAIVVNTYLMSQSSWMSFVAFLIWAAIGFVIYFAYGIRHSELNHPLSKLPYFAGDKDDLGGDAVDKEDGKSIVDDVTSDSHPVKGLDVGDSGVVGYVSSAEIMADTGDLDEREKSVDQFLVKRKNVDAREDEEDRAHPITVQDKDGSHDNL